MMNSLSARRGHLIARGNTADVRSWSSTTVVKVLRADLPRSWASLEATITALVHDAGFPAPAVEDVVEVEGRPGIVFERVDGPSMWEQMLRSPRELEQLTRAFVDLQCDLHSSRAPAGLPDQQTRLAVNISQADLLLPEEQEAATQLVDRMPRGHALCHGDMHPRNILMSPNGMVFIDWFDASFGNPVADIARSSLLLRPQQLGEMEMHHLDGARPEVLSLLHARYMSAMLSRRSIDEHEFVRWEAVVAAARLAEPVPKGEMLRVWRAWRDSADAAREPPLTVSQT